MITFNATVVDSTTAECEENLAQAVAYEFCCSRYIYGQDTATIYVPILIPGIDVEKYVWDGVCSWVDEIWADYCTNVRFKITVENVGESVLINIIIKDILPESLEYADSATLNGDPFEPTISPDGKTLTWTWNILEPDEVLVIEFDAHVIGMPCSEDINWAEAWAEGSCSQLVTDKDSATVFINGMCLEKKVWDDKTGAWLKETTADVGEQVRFRIIIYYYGDYRLYNIKVRDRLPPCLEYADDATVNFDPYEPEISSDGKTLCWNLTGTEYDLLNGDSLIIEFDVLVIDNQCEPCINWVNVTANECSGQTFYGDDSTTVYVECAFVADAGGPYSGEIDENIQITGSATGGAPPYIYDWDLDDDGQYDDAAGKSITHSWVEAGDYIIRLKVTDDEDDTAYDYAFVSIGSGENNPPAKPSKPAGPTRGRIGIKYMYSTSTTDSDGDQVMYLFDGGGMEPTVGG